jgi:hypothetical protein
MDFALIRKFFASGGTVVPSPSFGLEKCAVNGDQSCSLADFSLVRKATAQALRHSQSPVIVQGCPADIP